MNATVLSAILSVLLAGAAAPVAGSKPHTFRRHGVRHPGGTRRHP